ncbi:hypothetical protein [Acidobacterium sp. S8]|nr:hypothetical protein [Acidobacterium sp. S8]
MADKLIPIGFHVLEGMFFTGAIGCAVTIFLSWIEIFAKAFSEDRPGDK